MRSVCVNGTFYAIRLHLRAQPSPRSLTSRSIYHQVQYCNDECWFHGTRRCVSVNKWERYVLYLALVTFSERFNLASSVECNMSRVGFILRGDIFFSDASIFRQKSCRYTRIAQLSAYVILLAAYHFSFHVHTHRISKIVCFYLTTMWLFVQSTY